MENIINEKFIDFLIRAKKSTYANSTIEKVKSSRVGSSDYHYEEKIDNKKYIYHDTSRVCHLKRLKAGLLYPAFIDKLAIIGYR